ncbi:NAD(P)H-quinone oxidoreductase [Aliiglaciecola sp. CAU 1673]|uniref:NAD(P)H-quinone oxidoreductase n=1 Tax=Aliiglaciecola sp. CAU 1673 TaxID=3032595 RepID=UPI0023DB898A|nr:NAD(P)H-quinone oxidoreductase [Aliiglaciecola sp. CAU 1673]MDF2177575.1 NAD(P)H-quinone oxidoreductase [Aliiglaciecola sp. CAU 1673]
MRFIDYQSGTLRIEQMPAPEAGVEEVIVAVEAFGINRADLLQREGKYPPPKGESPVLGLEVAGTVAELGAGVTGWKPGDKVCALVPGGGYAELVRVKAAQLMPIPDGMSMQSAAGLPEIFLTAYGALIRNGQLVAGQKVLIHAGASGVGSAAIQLCKVLGAKVAVTASSQEKLAFCQSLGADLLVNYRTEDVVEKILGQWPGVDLIVDIVGGKQTNSNLKLLNLDGRIVQLAMLAGRLVQEFDMGRLLQKRATLMGSTLRNRSDEYKAHLVADLLAQHGPDFAQQRLQVPLDSTYKVSDLEQAHQRMVRNQNLGKMVGYW